MTEEISEEEVRLQIEEVVNNIREQLDQLDHVLAQWSAADER